MRSTEIRIFLLARMIAAAYIDDGRRLRQFSPDDPATGNGSDTSISPDPGSRFRHTRFRDADQCVGATVRKGPGLSSRPGLRGPGLHRYRFAK
ncbi:unnamed protein product [Amoebophrya sp. A120]|nr:unnamed protein product [Amoebophrya sp. A120]|eukprot:GSA120T00025539001.1